MINRPLNHNHFSLLYIYQGSFFRELIVPCSTIFIFSSIVYWLEAFVLTNPIPLNTAVFTLMGVALAIYHGFCNNAAYDRFWEARKLWSNLVGHSLDLARQVMNNHHIEVSDKNAFIRLIIAYAHSLRHELRHEDRLADLARILDDAQYHFHQEKQFTTFSLSNNMASLIGKWQADGHINGWQWQQLSKNIGDVINIQANCERINNTPIPFAYFVLLHRTVYFYCFLLPFGLGNTVGWMTPIMATFVAYTFMALNEIVDEISNPFGKDANDLPLTQLCYDIEAQLADLSGQQFTPPPKETLPQYIVQ